MTDHQRIGRAFRKPSGPAVILDHDELGVGTKETTALALHWLVTNAQREPLETVIDELAVAFFENDKAWAVEGGCKYTPEEEPKARLAARVEALEWAVRFRAADVMKESDK